MNEPKWVVCPKCGKSLCKADATGTLKLWCKACRKEMTVELPKSNLQDANIYLNKELQRLKQENAKLNRLISQIEDRAIKGLTDMLIK